MTQTPSSVATMPEGQVHSATHTSMQAGGSSLFAQVIGQALPQVENTWLFGHTEVGGSVAKEKKEDGKDSERKGKRGKEGGRFKLAQV